MSDLLELELRLLTVTQANSSDMAKAAGGNRAAITRVRKVMQTVKDIAQEIRVVALTVKPLGD